VPGGKHQVWGLLVVPDRQHLSDLLVRQERQQAGHVATLRVPTGLRQVVRLRPVDPAGRGEEQNPVVGGGGEHVRHHVVAAQRGAADPDTAASLHPVLVGAGALRVPVPADRHHHVLIGNQVLERELAVGGDDLRTSRVAVLLGELGLYGGGELSLALCCGRAVIQSC